MAIVGSGYMGGGIAQVLAMAGCRVALADVTGSTAEEHHLRLLRESRDFVDAGLFPPGTTETLERNLHPAESIKEAVGDAEFIEEAVPEDIEVKHAILKRISDAAQPDAIIATNTSAISIGELATVVGHSERFLGIHFINPAPFVPGVELIPHAGTSASIVETVRLLMLEVGKKPATVKDVTGFVVPRLQHALFTEAAQIVEEGIATPEDVDTLVRTTFGLRFPFFGPFAVADMAGLDVYASMYRVLQPAFPGRFPTPRILQDLVDAGKLGTKTGAGFFEATPEQIAALTLYRNRAYVELQRLIDMLGPAPSQVRR